MRRSSGFKVQGSEVAFLWDESFLWGLMAYKTLKALGLPFDLIQSEDIRKGCLEGYRMLFVPGGWASNKLKALGIEGVQEIRRFVHEGGNYFGICGGAGLGTVEGIGLLNIKRKPTNERVPSFSGRIKLNIKEAPVFTPSPLHPFTHSLIFHAWWPSQFVIDDREVEVIATFGEALDDSFSSDLNVGDVRREGNWQELERLYGINLDPERLRDEPAVIEGRAGSGRVILSLVHFDTPEDENGAIVLRNIWRYLGGVEARSQESAPKVKDKEKVKDSYPRPTMEHNGKNSAKGINLLFRRMGAGSSGCGAALLSSAAEIIDFGIRNSLWFWRTPMLLGWRRGVRGLEYCTLYGLIKELVELENKRSSSLKVKEERNQITGLLELCTLFKEKALRLLMFEREALKRGVITYEYSDDPEIQALRKELFGNSKSHGGKFKELLDRVDRLLYPLLATEGEADPCSEFCGSGAPERI